MGWEPTDVNQPQWIGSPHGNRDANLRYVRYDNLPNQGSTDGMNSGHPGGVHVVAGDGAVHFVSNSIHPLVWTSLGTITRKSNLAVSTYNPDGVWKPNGANHDEIQAQWD